MSAIHLLCQDYAHPPGAKKERSITWSATLVAAARQGGGCRRFMLTIHA